LKSGEADYLLFADEKIIGTVEAKPEGYTLIGVEEQSGNYGKGVLENHPKWHDPLPFAYESTGTETRFTNRLDAVPTSRNIFAFHRPETLVEWAQTERQLSDREQKKRLKSGTLSGVELVDGVAPLCCMNLLLHGIASEDTDDVPIQVKDALAGNHGEYEMVLTNPPFGKKSSVTIVNETGDEEKQSLVVHRDDFWASTSNKQLNFLQHVFTILKQHGRATI